MRMIVLIIAIFLIGCSSNNYRYKPTAVSIERERLANEITVRVAKKLKRAKGLLACGFGGQTSNGVQMLALSFDYRQPTNTEKGRELLVYALQEFISEVNSEVKIRPYLTNYPFNPKNIEIRIFLQNSDGSKLNYGLHVLSACRGILEYDIDDPDGPLFKTLLEETYEEALEKLNAQEETAFEEPAVAMHI